MKNLGVGPLTLINYSNWFFLIIAIQNKFPKANLLLRCFDSKNNNDIK